MSHKEKQGMVFKMCYTQISNHPWVQLNSDSASKTSHISAKLEATKRPAEREFTQQRWVCLHSSVSLHRTEKRTAALADVALEHHHAWKRRQLDAEGCGTTSPRLRQQRSRVVTRQQSKANTKEFRTDEKLQHYRWFSFFFYTASEPILSVLSERRQGCQQAVIAGRARGQKAFVRLRVIAARNSKYHWEDEGRGKLHWTRN